MGLRKAEALALTWDDIDLNKKQLSVNKTLALGFENKLLVLPPKTKRSKRTVLLTNHLTLVLTEYKLANRNKIIFNSS